MSITTVCPRCGTSVKTVDGSEGKRARCKTCQTVFVVGSTSISTVCPGCGTRVTTVKGSEGKRARCKTCQTVFVVANPASVKPPADTVEVASPNAKERPESLDNRLRKIVIGGAGGFLILCIIVLLSVTFYNMSQTRKSRIELSEWVTQVISNSHRSASRFNFDRAFDNLQKAERKVASSTIAGTDLTDRINAAILDVRAGKSEYARELADGYVVFGTTMVKPAQYTVLRKWNPNKNPAGYGAELLVNQEVTEQELVTLVNELSRGHDLVFIGIYSSRAAYDAGEKNEYGDVFARGYILCYVKNLTGQGAYRGFNEIRWMQEKGRFAHKFGAKTKL